MIIEIGTSDFNTLAGIEPGIFIEPVKYYFDRLPNNCIKENVAISNYEGFAKMYYVTEKIIKKYNAPNWLRGCCSMYDYHPRLLQYFKREDIIIDIVKVTKIKKIIEKYNINFIDFLKIDTEGHDAIILNNFFDEVDIVPNRIQFENNILSNSTEIESLVRRLELKEYKIEYIHNNIIAVL
jgi:FkbM family methyltransferase